MTHEMDAAQYQRMLDDLHHGPRHRREAWSLRELALGLLNAMDKEPSVYKASYPTYSNHDVVLLATELLFRLSLIP